MGSAWKSRAAIAVRRLRIVVGRWFYWFGMRLMCVNPRHHIGLVAVDYAEPADCAGLVKVVCEAEYGPSLLCVISYLPAQRAAVDDSVRKLMPMIDERAKKYHASAFAPVQTNGGDSDGGVRRCE